MSLKSGLVVADNDKFENMGVWSYNSSTQSLKNYIFIRFFFTIATGFIFYKDNEDMFTINVAIDKNIDNKQINLMYTCSRFWISQHSSLTKYPVTKYV